MAKPIKVIKKLSSPQKQVFFDLLNRAVRKGEKGERKITGVAERR